MYKKYVKDQNINYFFTNLKAESVNDHLTQKCKRSSDTRQLNVKNKVFSHCALGGLYPICHIEVAIYISNKNNVDRARTILKNYLIERRKSSISENCKMFKFNI